MSDEDYKFQKELAEAWLIKLKQVCEKARLTLTKEEIDYFESKITILNSQIKTERKNIKKKNRKEYRRIKKENRENNKESILDKLSPETIETLASMLFGLIFLGIVVYALYKYVIAVV